MQCKTYEQAVQCPNTATVTVFWPGKTTEACPIHAAKLQRIAEAMGFVLDSRPIEIKSEAP